jgi:hypothetical protein
MDNGSGTHKRVGDSPGPRASVIEVARQHDLNSNLIYLAQIDTVRPALSTDCRFSLDVDRSAEHAPAMLRM